MLSSCAANEAEAHVVSTSARRSIPVRWHLNRARRLRVSVWQMEFLHPASSKPEVRYQFPRGMGSSRSTRNNLQHPTYKALAELGKALKTIFLCQYLQSPELRREIQEGLNVIENWNSANGFILYGKGGEIATNRREDQELTMLSLHLLQLCLVYINTLMIQRILGEPHWDRRLTSEDRRGLTPLMYHHVTPYGLFRLNMAERLIIEEVSAA